MFIASRIFVVADGRRARTVNVQSSWFCSNRRRKLQDAVSQERRSSITPIVDSLLLGNPVAAHALPRIADLVQDILRHHVSSSNDTDTDGDGSPVVTQPAPCRCEHNGRTIFEVFLNNGP